MQYPLLPIELAKFWYVDAPLGLLSYFGSLNAAFFRMFSVVLLLRTFFQPIKNEYRQGLVGFSIGLGIFVKTVLLLLAVFLFVLLLLAECFFMTLFVMLPILSIIIFFLAL